MADAYQPAPLRELVAVCLGLDLAWGDELPGPVGEPQGLGNGQGVLGDALQMSPGHLQLGAMGEVLAAFFNKWAILVASQRLRAREESLKHSRSSQGGSGQERRGYVAFRGASTRE